MTDAIGAIYLDDNDQTVTIDMTEWSAETGQHEPVSELDLTAFISAEDGGDAIHADVSETMTEIGETATYYAHFDGEAVSAHLADYVGRIVYWRFVGEGYNTYKKARVYAHRPASA